MYTQDNCWLKESCKKCLGSGCPEVCPKFIKLDYLYKESRLPDNKRVKTKLVVDSDNTDLCQFTYLSHIEKTVNKFVDGGKNLYIHSKTCGNGKSEWAIRILQSYLNSVWYSHTLSCAGLFLSVPKYFIDVKDNLYSNSEAISKLNSDILTADIVVFDDVATKTITTFEAEKLFSIVDTRMSAKKSCIFTSNMDTEDMYALLGARLASRIVNFSTELVFMGKDKRKLR